MADVQSVASPSPGARPADVPEDPRQGTVSDGPALPSPGRRRRVTRGTLAVGAVAALAGAMFATNATLFREAADRHPENLAELVAVESARLEKATDDVEALRSEVETLLEGAASSSTLPEVPTEVSLAAGRLAVTGPGVVVAMWDAPAANAPEGARPDDLLVHQQDLEAVMNALWAGGAEAMTIQGDRVTARTDVRCVGNVLLLHGRTYSPPYEIAAIGDPAALQDALDNSPGVQIYLQYVAAVRLGWSLEEQRTITMEAAESVSAPRYASIIPGAITSDEAQPADDGARSGAA